MVSEPRFFVLRADDFRNPYDTAFLPGDGVETGEAARCPKCGAIIGMREWLPPYRVQLEVHGNDGAGDFAQWIGGHMLISERMATAFRSEGLTGLEGFHPAEVVKMNARAKRLGLPAYLLAGATYGQAALDEARSRLRRPKPLACDECRTPGLEGVYGFRIQSGTWDGLDAFFPRGLQSQTVVSERFADFVRRHGFTNIKLVPTEQFVWDPHRKGPPVQVAQG